MVDRQHPVPSRDTDTGNRLEQTRVCTQEVKSYHLLRHDKCVCVC